MLINTTAKKVHEELKKEMPEIYPQRFQGYKVDSANYNVIISDIETYWNTEARFREGFTSNEELKTVTIPNFFTKVNGIYRDKKKYIEFVKMLRESSNTITLEKDCSFYDILELKDEFYDAIDKNDGYDKSNFSTEYFNTENYDFVTEPTISNVLSGLFYCFRIKNSNEFRFEYLTSDKKQLVLDTVIRIITDSRNPLRLKSLSDYTQFISLALTFDNIFINMLNNFDYGLEIPKIVVSTSNLNKTTAMFLYLMNEMGIDIVILSPSGKSNVEKYYDINNLSLGFFDTEFDLDSEVVLDSDKEKIKKKKKEEQKIVKKRQLENFIELIYFPHCLWGILVLIPVITGMLFHWNGFLNTIVQIGALIVALIYWIAFGDSGEKKAWLMTWFYGILFSAIVVLLCVRGIYAIYRVETNPQDNTTFYSGFQNIEEEEIIGTEFTIRQRDEGVVVNKNNLFYYLENNSRNQFNIVFEVCLNNAIIYRSAEMEPLNYVKHFYLESNIPDGDTTLTIKYYKAEDYDARSNNNTSIGERDFVVHSLTEEEYEEIQEKIRSDGSADSYGYTIQ